MDVTLKTTEEVERFFRETGNVLLGSAPKMRNAQIVFTEKTREGACILCCGEDVTLTGASWFSPALVPSFTWQAETPHCGWMQRCMLGVRSP